MNARITTLALLLAALSPCVAMAWDGYDDQSGSSVEIDQGNLVRPGETIELYDYGTSEYRDVQVESVERNGSSVEVEVYDYDSGEYRTLDMED
ncbi:hypothetical protein SAMN05216206_2781 [Pseudomonas guineae]|uniref:Uncharacterized protein n=1 Tax=Pseudomonas guineae TaxID=425504 RepID=A0A1I3KCW8_9PSED|nr:DUF5334 family protein [Pseudomonas guineae]SFI70190.1 hypothetical protein SAMN05216206_2781 [Pseudomonas guineae]